ncbi:MAG TPA: hypothetical protein VGK09_05260 [Rhodocyclaceae bacterium]|jgi:hypothetical protein
MNIWDGEIWEEFFKAPSKMIDCGSLYGPVDSFKLERDKETHQLILKTKSSLDSKRPADYQAPIAGTVRTSVDTATIELISGLTVHLRGVRSYSERTHTNASGEGFKEETSSIHSIEAFKDGKTISCAIEWVGNVDTSTYHYPDWTSGDEVVTSTRTFGRSSNIFFKQQTDSKEYYGSSCLRLEVGGCELFLALNRDFKDDAIPGSGFILYKGFPDKEVRDKIRDCLSFALGRPLVYLGYTLLTEDSDFVGFQAVGAHSVDGKLYAIHTCPPAPVSKSSFNFIEQDVISNTVNKLFASYEDLNFLHVSWIYWHALCAPIHTRAAQLGAGIEALQNAFRKLNRNGYSTTLLESKDAKYLRESFLTLVDAMNIDPDIKKALENKANGLNDVSQNMLNDRFFSFLSLELGEDEKRAWRRRNEAAHGTIVEAEDYPALIRENRLLLTIFHRIVLSLSEAHDEYIDYYTNGFPIRKLPEPAGGPGTRFTAL